MLMGFRSSSFVTILGLAVSAMLMANAILVFRSLRPLSRGPVQIPDGGLAKKQPRNGPDQADGNGVLGQERVQAGQDLSDPRQLSTPLLGLAVLSFLVTLASAVGQTREKQQQDLDLGDAQSRFEAFIDHSPMNAYIKDAEGRMVWTSKNMRQNFPVSAHWLGQRQLAGLPGDTIERLNQDIPQILSSGLPKQDEVDIPSPRGIRRLLVVRFPLTQGRRQYLGGYSMDIQDRVDAHRRLESYARDLESTNQELQNFNSVAAHDLQEPLRKILTFGERLNTAIQGPGNETARADLDRMLAAAGRMRALIEDLLSYTRVASRPWTAKDTDLNLCLSQAWSDLELAVEQSGAVLETEPLPTLRADASQLRQLFVNLLGNSIKYRRPEIPPRIKVAWTALPGRVELRVSDNGIGFEQAKAEKIFELFQRLHGRSEYPGNGLGLAICRKVAERHGGSLRAMSRPGEGATFILDLPRGGPDPEEPT
jgi:signal transduction histidine kinase